MLTVILSGGASRRMGRDKVVLPARNGEALYKNLISRYSPLGDVALSVDKAGKYELFGAAELVDEYPGEGPLNGVVSAFSQTDADLIFLTAADMPCGSAEAVGMLCRLLGDADACIAGTEERPEPLMGVYRRSCLSAALECLASGERAMSALLRRISAKYAGELPGAETLTNLNTPDDYRKYILSEKGGYEMNSIFTRRSIRRYTDQPVEAEKIERLLRAAMQAPSGKNAQPWDFMVITDSDDRLALSEMSEYAHMCRFAPVVIVTLANLNRVADDGLWWVQDMSAATQNILLQAVEEGLGAVWLGFYPIEERIAKFREYFALPENIVPFSLVALGYSEKENKFIDRYDPARIHFGKW